jgi:hypothetical protein
LKKGSKKDEEARIEKELIFLNKLFLGMAFHNYCHMLLIIKSNLDTMLKDTVQG